jgi:hypothetical protein
MWNAMFLEAAGTPTGNEWNIVLSTASLWRSLLWYVSKEVQITKQSIKEA